jgi:hypothetical protein
MRIRDRGQARAGGRAKAAQTPEQLAAALTEARFWREHWRGELEARGVREEQAQPPPTERSARAAKVAQARFAAAMARAEFGRAHWDARREAELAAARKVRPKAPR